MRLTYCLVLCRVVCVTHVKYGVMRLTCCLVLCRVVCVTHVKYGVMRLTCRLVLCGVVSHSCQVWGNETDLSLSVVWCGEFLMSSMG